MKTAKNILDILRSSNLNYTHEMLDALVDSEVLAGLGISSEDQPSVEALFKMLAN